MDLNGKFNKKDEDNPRYTKKLNNNGNYQTTKNIADVAERVGRNLFVVCS